MQSILDIKLRPSQHIFNKVGHISPQQEPTCHPSLTILCRSCYTQRKRILRVFSDASTDGYGTDALLWHCTNPSFIMASNRVAPLKNLTLPQLELMAALTSARLADFIEQSFKNRFNNLRVILGTDSQIILHWLNSQKSLKPFVQNCVQEINQLYPAAIWHYWPTSDNQNTTDATC